MDKQFIINAISNLIEAEREWKRLCDIVFQLGGELEETRFEEVMYTHEELVYKLLMEQSEFGEVNEAEFDLFKHFGFQSGRDVDKFKDFPDCKTSANGIKYITKGTNAYLSVKVSQTVDLGSHTMFIGEITDMEVLSETASASYEYYQNNIKPKPQAVRTTEDGQTVWRCVICGYEYVGEELPEDFICPICKHPASDFEKVKK